VTDSFGVCVHGIVRKGSMAVYTCLCGLVEFRVCTYFCTELEEKKKGRMKERKKEKPE